MILKYGSANPKRFIRKLGGILSKLENILKRLPMEVLNNFFNKSKKMSKTVLNLYVFRLLTIKDFWEISSLIKFLEES